MDISERSKEDIASQSPQVITEEDDSVFYSEEEEIPQQILDSIWAPRSGEPIWPEELNSAPQIYVSETQDACHSTELKEASSELDSLATMEKMESNMDKVINESSTDTDVHGETAANSRKITLAEEFSTPPMVPLRASNPAEAQMKEKKADTYTDESSCCLSDGSGETGLPGESSMSVEEVQQEHGLDVMCDSDNKPFNHLTHAKYGTVSYRRIRRGQTRKNIEMFESMMQL